MRPVVRSLTLAWALAAFAPHLVAAQAYRASVLYMEPADSSASSGPASAPETKPDSAALPDFHSPGVPRRQPTIVAPIAGSLAGGIGLAYAGLLIGNSTDPHSEDFPVGAIIGFVIGEVIGVPLGAHLGNGRRGNFAGDLGISVLGALAGLSLGSLDSGGGAYIVGAVGQIAITVAIERSQGRKRAAREAAASP